MSPAFTMDKHHVIVGSLFTRTAL